MSYPDPVRVRGANFLSEEQPGGARERLIAHLRSLDAIPASAAEGDAVEVEAEALADALMPFWESETADFTAATQLLEQLLHSPVVQLPAGPVLHRFNPDYARDPANPDGPLLHRCAWCGDTWPDGAKHVCSGVQEIDQGAAAVGTDERAPADPVALLRKVSDGRREYARGAPEDMRSILLAQGQAFELAARIVEGDQRPLYGLLPSWRWTDEMSENLHARLGQRQDLTADQEVPPRVLAAESRREVRDLLGRSSLGCPLTPRCGHMLGDHEASSYLVDGTPLNPVCTVAGCECGSAITPTEKEI